MSERKVASEDVLGQKTDLCLSNLLVKTSIGFGAGVVLSALIFKRRAWPVFLSTGFGLGNAYGDCERTFNPANVPGYRIVGPASAKPEPKLV